MEDPQIIFSYVLLLLFQTLHILEEIGMEAYEVAGTLKKYLVAASIIVVISYAPLFLMLKGLAAGYYLALLGAVLGTANGLVHLAGYLKTRSVRGTLGAGLFTGIPLGILGVYVLCRLVQLYVQ